MFWNVGDLKYVKIQGLFRKLIAHKGNVYRVQDIGEDTIKYIVTDGSDK